MHVKLKETGSMRAICIEHIGPYCEIGSVFEKLGQFAVEYSVPVKNSKWMGVYWDDPAEVAPEKLRSEACVTIDESTSVPDVDGVTVKTIDGGSFMMSTHTGSYSSIGAAWQELWTEFEKSGRKYRHGPCLELYVKGAGSGLPEEEWVTDFYIPIV